MLFIIAVYKFLLNSKVNLWNVGAPVEPTINATDLSTIN